jgi:hypothetical protein
MIRRDPDLRHRLLRAFGGVVFTGALAGTYWSAAHSPSNIITHGLRTFYEGSIAGPQITLLALAALFALITVAGVVWLAYEGLTIVLSSRGTK